MPPTLKRKAARSKKSKARQTAEQRETILQHALAAVKRDGMKVNDAAVRFNVSSSTLYKRYKGHTKPRTRENTGRSTALTTEDEEKLANYIIYMCRWGYGKTKEMVQFMASLIAKQRNNYEFKHGYPSDGWFECFLGRHPQLSVRKAQLLDTPRTHITREQLNEFYQRLTFILVENKHNFDFNHHPERIWNMDETSFVFSEINQHVLAERGKKNVKIVAVSRNKYEKCSVVICVSAAGSYIPPMHIIKSDSGKVPPNIQDGAVENSIFVGQTNAWMTKDLCVEWFSKCFLKRIGQERPHLLIFDGLKAHVTWDMIQLAISNDIILFCLPAHGSHVIQPLDVSVLGPMKNGWRRALERFTHEVYELVSIKNFAYILCETWKDCMSADVIKSGFATTGIFPCNRMAITDDQLLNQRKYASLVMEYPGKYKADKETSTDDLQLFIDNNSDSSDEDVFPSTSNEASQSAVYCKRCKKEIEIADKKWESESESENAKDCRYALNVDGKITTYDSTMSRICSLPLTKAKRKNARKPAMIDIEPENSGNEGKKKPNPSGVDITNDSYVRVYGAYLENQKRLQKEKEDKRNERKKKAEEKKKMQEIKKKLSEEKKRKIVEMKAMKKMKANCKLQTASTRNIKYVRKGSTQEDMECTDEDGYICWICHKNSGKLSTVKGKKQLLWVGCDGKVGDEECDVWCHQLCITDFDKKNKYFCTGCKGNK